jgi:beta-fructofuranosidase
VWDSWVADHGELYQVFFLKASRALGDPALRHTAATVDQALSTSRGLGTADQRIGVAQSDDLFSWRRVGDTLLIGPDVRWYRTLARHPGLSCTWRDPFVFADPGVSGR